MNKAKTKLLFERFKALNPKPTTELLYRNSFELLIAVILSAQATDKGVNKATPALFAKAPDPQSMLALGEEGLTQYVKTIGLYRGKVKNILKTCQMLVEQHQSQVPDNREALEALPGVGRKTANVILNTAFGHPLIAVDTHVFRVANRIGLAKGASVKVVEEKLAKTVPKEYLHDAHHWLILHGRYICVARKPKCYECPIVDLCEFKDKNLK
jgi:endonuclease-3